MYPSKKKDPSFERLTHNPIAVHHRGQDFSVPRNAIQYVWITLQEVIVVHTTDTYSVSRVAQS